MWSCINLFMHQFITFLFSFLKGISHFCGATDMPVFDFWWRLLWVSKPECAAFFPEICLITVCYACIWTHYTDKRMMAIGNLNICFCKYILLQKHHENYMTITIALNIFTGCNEVVAKVMFLPVSVILLTWGALPQCVLGYHSPGADTPAEQTPPNSRQPPEQTPPIANTPPAADTIPTPPRSRDQPPGSRLWNMVNERPVRILLECILVLFILTVKVHSHLEDNHAFLSFFFCYQWPIQDFPEEGASTLQGAPTYDFAKFSQKLHEIERIWTRGGARPKFYYVDPQLVIMCKQ